MAGTFRVLHVAKSLGLGGTEKVLQLLASHLDRDRFTPAVFAFSDGERGVQLRRAGVPTFIGGDLLTVLRRFRPHVAHLHRAGWPEPELLRPFRLAGTPVVVETNVFGRHDPSPAAAVLDATLFVSDFCARRFARQTGIPTEPPRWRVLPNPVDTDFFAAACPPRPDATPPPVIGRISRADPGKWSPLALEILPRLARRVPGFRYRIVGGIPEARDFVTRHGLGDCVEFLDPVTDDAELAAFYGSITLLAHANDTGESFGLVIAEAMACGLPVVTHPAAGLRDNAQLDLVRHGVTGLVADNAEDYAGAVAWLLEHPGEARRMGEAGRTAIAALSRVQDVTRRLENIYLELLAAKDVASDSKEDA